MAILRKPNKPLVAPHNLLDIDEVARSLRARPAAIQEWSAAGLFPQPIRTGACTRDVWPEVEIHRYRSADAAGHGSGAGSAKRAGHADLLTGAGVTPDRAGVLLIYTGADSYARARTFEPRNAWKSGLPGPPPGSHRPGISGR